MLQGSSDLDKQGGRNFMLHCILKMSVHIHVIWEK